MSLQPAKNLSGDDRTGGGAIDRASVSTSDREASVPWWKYPVLRNALVAGVIALMGFGLGHAGWISSQLEVAFYVLAIPLGGYHWAREAVEDLFKEKSVGIDLLMLGATIGSCVLGLFDEAASLVILYGSAEGLEEYTYARTRWAVRSLLKLAPKQACVARDGGEQIVPAESLSPGDRFLVRPGEAVPTDGIIRWGHSSLDESSVTGESIPVDKKPGMTVFGGTLNRQGALEIEATAAFADNTLAKIVNLVEQAQEAKGRAQRWIERFGHIYSPCVLAASALLVLVPWAIGLPVAGWANRAVVLLVAAAPCALVMSMPVAMAAGITRAGRRGILIKGGAHLEHLGAVRCIAFDKTGTLTTGKPEVSDVISLQGSESELLALAAGIERFSEHPLARAIVEHATLKSIQPAESHDFESFAGAGARAVVQGRKWFVGSPESFDGIGLKPLDDPIGRLREAGKTVVIVGEERAPAGLLALQDRVRPKAREIVAALRDTGVNCVMLTGDNERTARAVASTVGIDEVRAGLKPEDKVAAVAELERTFGAVAMVGDGVNDAPALAAATCGMAMGIAGTDAAIETADVALMADDLAKVEEALQLGRRVLRISRQNIVFSILILAVLIPAAVTGVMSVTWAVLAHELSELIAVANGLRAGR